MNEDNITISRAELKKIIEEEVSKKLREVITQTEILPTTIKQRHIEGAVIKRGLAADLPTNGDASGIFAFYETDSHKLQLWDGDSWEEEEFT